MAKKKQPLNFASAGRRTTRTLMTEIATRARSIDFFFFGGFLPNPDPILKKLGKDQAVYEDIQGDGHLTGVIGARGAGVKSLLWELDRGKSKSKQAQAAELVLKKLDMDRIFNEILEANYRGYQPMEIMWEKPDGSGLILPSDIVGKPPEWFQFDEENQLRFRTLGSEVGEELPPMRFLLPRRKPSYKNPYGEALLSKCFWPATFKRNGVKFWATFTEKYGIPYIIGKLPRNAGDEEYKKLATNLEAMVQDAVAAIPDDSSVEILEPGGKSASADIFERLIAWANAEMSKAIVGHGAGADSTPGKLGGEDNAEAVRDHLVEEDKRLVERTMNQFLRWFHEINFGAGEPPEFVMYAEEDVDLDQATRDEKLTSQGVRLSKAYYERTYGFEQGDIVSVDKPEPAPGPGQPQPGKGKPKSFAERGQALFADQAEIDAMLASITPEQLQVQAEGLLRPILAMIESAQSFEEIEDKLYATYPQMDSKALQALLTQATFVAEMRGRAQA